MKVILVGGQSALSIEFKKKFKDSLDIYTAGRTGCDFHIDLQESLENVVFPSGMDVMVNTAADFGGTSDQDILRAIDVNLSGTLKLCQSAHRNGIKHFVLISSIFSHIEKNLPGYNIYAITKRQCEEIISYYCQLHHLSLTILRPSQIYGDSNLFSKHQPFFYKIIDDAEYGREIKIYGTIPALRNYIHADDLSTVIQKVIEKRITGSFDCCYPENISYLQIADAAIAAFESKSQVVFLRDKPNVEDNIFSIDNSIYKQIDFFPEISIINGTKRIARFRNQIKQNQPSH